MGAGFVRIPIIEQTVGVPNAPAPARRDESPPPSGLKAVAEQVGQIGAGIGKVLEIQGVHQQILDQNDAETAWKAGHASNVEAAKASGAPGNTWAQTVAENDRKLSEQILSDYPHVAGALGARFQVLQQLTSKDVASEGAVQTAKTQHEQYTAQQKGRAIEAGANYVVNADGSIADNPHAQAIDAKEKLDQQAMWGGNKEALDFHAKLYEDEKTLQRAQAIAQGSASEPFLLDKFIKSQPVGTFTPTQIKGFQELQQSAITLPDRQMLADRGNARVNANHQIEQLLAAHDPSAEAKAQTFYDARVIPEDDFRRHFAHPPTEEDAPGAKANALTKVTSSPENYDAGMIAAIPGLSRGSVAEVQLAWKNASRAGKTPVGIAKGDMENHLVDTLRTTGDVKLDATIDAIDPKFKGDLAKKVKNFSDARTAQARTAEDIQKAREETDKFIQQERAQKLQEIKDRYPEIMKKLHLSLPPAIPADVNAAAAARARSEGWRAP